MMILKPPEELCRWMRWWIRMTTLTATVSDSLVSTPVELWERPLDAIKKPNWGFTKWAVCCFLLKENEHGMNVWSIFGGLRKQCFWQVSEWYADVCPVEFHQKVWSKTAWQKQLLWISLQFVNGWKHGLQLLGIPQFGHINRKLH